MLLQSLFVQLLHVVVKYYLVVMMNLNVMIILIHLPHLNLHLGTTNTTNHLPLWTTTATTLIPITVPQRSGSPGINGRIIPNPNTTPIPLDGLTIQSTHTNNNRMTNFLLNTHPNLLRHTHWNTSHMATDITLIALALLTHGLPLSLQDILPSTSRKDPEKNGLVKSVTPLSIQTECVRPMNLTPTSCHDHPLPLSKINMMKLWKNFKKLIQESHQTLRERLYCCSLVQASFQITTSPLATFENFLKPACLHLSCPYQISAGSKCPVLLVVKPVLLGRFAMEQPPVPLR